MPSHSSPTCVRKERETQPLGRTRRRAANSGPPAAVGIAPRREHPPRNASRQGMTARRKQRAASKMAPLLYFSVASITHVYIHTYAGWASRPPPLTLKSTHAGAASDPVRSWRPNGACRIVALRREATMRSTDAALGRGILAFEESAHTLQFVLQRARVQREHRKKKIGETNRRKMRGSNKTRDVHLSEKVAYLPVRCSQTS